jgi:hypothetical protein
MIVMRALFVTCLAAAPAALLAQQSTTPVTDAVRRLSQRRGGVMAAAAEAMPADKYGFKPTPQQMSFGELVHHVAGSNRFLCSAIAGVPAPAMREGDSGATASKDSLVADLKASFAFCDSALAKVDDSKLGESVPFFGGRQASRALALIDLAMDWADHYGQQAMYLRLNGILPPTARRQ